jgi:hypothetical protein
MTRWSRRSNVRYRGKADIEANVTTDVMIAACPANDCALKKAS